LVTVFQRQREVRFSLVPNCLYEIVQVVLVEENAPGDTVSIHFISDFLMRRYHKRFFQDPSFTDCMSFPLDQYPPFPNPRDLGDIFICPKSALMFAKNSEPVFWSELTLYLVHGMLHLLGYEDSSKNKRAIMKSREKAILKALINQGLLAKGTLRLEQISHIKLKTSSEKS
jgi:probable rRNA maturation factor